MSDTNKSYRIKYDINNPVDHLNIKIDQDFDLLEVLSLSITQEDVYKLYTSNYGVVVGRVLANNGFGIPNAKISIFLANNSTDQTLDSTILYPYTSTSDKDSNGIRYNLLPSQKVNKCHQNVGTLPSKRDVLDNNAKIEVFDNFYKYTTVTNASGDYMFFGIPTGSQQIHVDIDLSDIGILSQAPRDLEYQGYNIKQFDSPNKFKSSTNLDSLPQIISQDTTIFVYPFWGDESQAEIAISSKTINIQYQFEPTCVFMGSIFTDSLKSSISKTCRPDTTSGVMSELTASQGSIEMIRQTITNTIEQFDISGTRLINNDGVWCYQIPMNLDYVVTDEYGNLVPTTDPTTGIPTRAKVRFRITLDDNGDSFVQSKTGVYLVPNKPSGQTEDDYEFSSNCKDSSFVNLMWNKVYSVKNYIPRIGESAFLTDIATDRHFNGLKSVNYHESNNPAPYNNIWININLKFMLICLLTTIFINVVAFVNQIIHTINLILQVDVLGVGIFGPVINLLISYPIKFIIIESKIAGDNCDVLGSYQYFSPVIGSRWYDEKEYNDTTTKPVGGTLDKVKITDVTNCVQINLAAENDVINFDFTNDWLNGSLYAPRFLVKTNLNNKTGIQNSVYCGSWYQDYVNMYLFQTCAPSIDKNGNINSDSTLPLSLTTNTKCNSDKNCYEKNSQKPIGKGTISLDTANSIFYYRSVEYPGLSTGLKYLYTTDIILLGSLNDCDQDGIPQLHQLLPSTSFKLPPDSFEGDTTIIDSNGIPKVDEFYSATGKTMSGLDWGNKDDDGNYHLENGLFVAISCMDSDTIIKTCVNATRLCEVGIDFDERYTGSTVDGSGIIKYIDGYISTDEITNGDVRGMFATLNMNNLKIKQVKYNQIKYDFTYNYPNGFDGRLRNAGIIGSNPLYAGLSTDLPTDDYYNFRFGLSDSSQTGFDYIGDYSFPRYENSFYFYFGIKPGSTALDLFNNQYFVPCVAIEKGKFSLSLSILSNESICIQDDGIIRATTSQSLFPQDIYLNNSLIESNLYSDVFNLTGLTSAFYSIKVIDANNNSVNATIFLPKNSSLTYDYNYTNETNTTANDGTIIISNIQNPNNQIANYVRELYFYTDPITTVLLSTSTITDTGETMTNLSGGTYDVLVYESGCVNNSKQIKLNIKVKVELSNISITPNTLSQTEINLNDTIIDIGSSSITENGFIYGLTSDITLGSKAISNTLIGDVFSTFILELTPNTEYYVTAYAINNAGISYSNQMSFTTLELSIPGPMELTSTNWLSTDNGISTEGSIYGDGGLNITEYGIYYISGSTDPGNISYITGGTKVVYGINEDNLNTAFDSEITGLTSGSNYYLATYAINSLGIGYSNEYYTVITEEGPVISDIAAESESPTTITTVGNITDSGSGDIIEWGFYYTDNPAYWTTENGIIENGMKVEYGNVPSGYTLSGNEFNGYLTNLDTDSEYFIVAYAKNSYGITKYALPSYPNTPVQTLVGSISDDIKINIGLDQAYGGGIPVNAERFAISGETQMFAAYSSLDYKVGICYSETDVTPTTGDTYNISSTGHIGSVNFGSYPTGDGIVIDITPPAGPYTFKVRGAIFNLSGNLISYGDIIEVINISDY